MYRIFMALFLLGLSHCQTDDPVNSIQSKDIDKVLGEEEAKKEQDFINVIQQIFGKPLIQYTSTTTTRALPATVNPKTDDAVIVKVHECKTADGESGQCFLPLYCNIDEAPDRESVACTTKSEICCPLNKVKFSAEKQYRQVQKPVCGMRNLSGIATRIMSNEDETQFAEFPWVVAVLAVLPADDSEPDGQKLFVYTCGGSLIHPSVVLTAAHSVEPGEQYRARAGEWDTRTATELYPHQDRRVDRVLRHELFNTVRRNLHYDIALLILEKPMESALNVAPVCLPPPGQSAAPGARCFSSGWGKDNFGKTGKYQIILKKVELPVVDRDTCQDILRNTRLGPFFKLHGTFMCAGGEPGKDTCKGDGGSPLVCPIPLQTNRYMQNGMVAWGLGCGDDKPAVYADVGQLRSWIDREVTAAGFTTDTYTI